MRLSVLLPAAQVGTSADGTNDGVQKTDKATKGGNGGGVGETPVEQVDARGVPYMCLAQCEDMNTMVGHRKVPPMQVWRTKNESSAIPIACFMSVRSDGNYCSEGLSFTILIDAPFDRVFEYPAYASH